MIQHSILLLVLLQVRQENPNIGLAWPVEKCRRYVQCG